MRRVLFDENLPRQLRRELTEFVIRTVQEEGWGSFQNGQLVGRTNERDRESSVSEISATSQRVEPSCLNARETISR